MNRLKKFRRDKDSHFLTDPRSPLTKEQQRHFNGLRYFPENPSLVFDLVPEEFSEKRTVGISTSSGATQHLTRWGRVNFKVDGIAVQLTIFRNGHGLFLPFVDALAGHETYGAGRYLEPPRASGGRIHVDFNYAYNPYCAYNANWSCPIPPLENRIAVPIQAGEMTFSPET